MPLLKRREFKPLIPPDDLDPEEEVFVCRLTNEVFRDYDDFFKRTILCNSLVWSCSLTSRPGLTYQEALESEDRARKLLASFPVYLEPPVLFLVTLTQRGRLSDMCDDVFVFAKDRYFIGEIVDVTYKGKRETCRVEKVIPPGEYGKQLAETPPPPPPDTQNDEVMIVGENGEVTEVVVVEDDKVPKTPKSWKPKMLQPSGYKYEVLSLQGSGKYKVGADKVSRKKGLYTRDKNKLYLKQNCRMIDMVWRVKPEVAKRTNLESRKFTDFFAGPLPNFISTPAKRNKVGGARTAVEDDDLPLTEVKKKEAKLKKKEKTPDKPKKDAPPAKPRMTAEEREAMRQKLKELKLQEKQKRIEERMREREENRQKRLEEKAAKKEENRKAAEEDREKRKKERELMRLEKLRMEEALKEWNKPREDLECDDLKDLPKPNPVKCKIPQDLFGDALMLMEFLYAFGDQVGVLEEFPDGITLQTIEEALFSHQVDGALYDLLKLLLSCIFHLQDEEEEDERVDIKEHAMDTSLGDLAEILNEDDPTYAALSKAASSALIWSQVHQGTPLRSLPLESTTISEVLRLHLLASGAETDAVDAKWRYQQRGAYTFHDDPGMELRLKEPAILRALTNGNVYDLNPNWRMMIINTLCNQILSYVTVRDVIEESWDQWQVTKKEWREICRMERHREKEEATMKYKRKLEERARFQQRLMEEQKAHERAEEAKRLAEGTNVEGAESGAPQTDVSTAKPIDSTTKPSETLLADLGKELSPEEKEKRRVKEEAESAARKAEFLQQKEEYEKNLTEFSTRYSVTPVGLDRIFRRYWTFQSVPGLFIEVDKELMDGMDSLVLSKKTDDTRVNEEKYDSAQEQNSSGVSEDSNKENRETGVDGITGRNNSNSETKKQVLLNKTEEVSKLNSSKSNQEIKEVVEDLVKSVDLKKETVVGVLSPKEGAIEPMEVTGIKVDGANENTNNSAMEEKPKLSQEVLVNGMVEPEKMDVDGDEQGVKEESAPRTPVKNELGATVAEEDGSNQDIVPWAYYHRPEELEALLESLNARGYREGTLKTHLTQLKEKIVQRFDRFPANYIAGVETDENGIPWSSQKIPSTPRQVVIKMTSGKKGLVSNQADGDETLELLLREAILDLEERVWQGGLGIIKVDNRADWISAIEQGAYDRQCSEISWGPLWARSLMDDSDFLDMSISEPSLLEDSKKCSTVKSKDRVSELKKSETPTGSPAATRCSTPTVVDNIVRNMACALLQISQGLHDKYLIKPLGIREEEKRSGPRSRKVIKEAVDEESQDKKEEGEEGEKKPQKTCRDCWEESLMASTSLSQVFLHLSTLEQSILWSKSILNARCRICRRKGDAEAMLLCDLCDRGHHMYCLKPPLKNVPKGDWYCKDCTPKAVKRTPRKARRKTFDEEAEEKVEEEGSDEESEESDVEEDDDDAEEDQEEEDSDKDEEEEEMDEGEEDDAVKEGEGSKDGEGDEEGDGGEREGEEEVEREDSEEQVVEEEAKSKAPVKRGRSKVRAPPPRRGPSRERPKGALTAAAPKAAEEEASTGRGRSAVRRGAAMAAEAMVKEKLVSKRAKRSLSVRSEGGRKKAAEPASEESSDDGRDRKLILTSGKTYYTCHVCRHGGQLLTCVGCEGAVHLGCLPPGTLQRGKPWKCGTCSGGKAVRQGDVGDTSQHGEVCAECNHGGKLIFCSGCPAASHLGCCHPPFSRMPRKAWQCNRCRGEGDEPSQQGRGTALSSQKSSRHSRRRPSDGDVHSVHVDDEVTLNISDDGGQPKKALPGKRGTKRSRSREEDADTEEEDEPHPSKKKSLTVVLTRQDKELRKLVSTDIHSPEPQATSSRRRSSLTGRGSLDMLQLSVCEQLLKELVRHPDAGPFLVPVSKKIVPDYYRVIKRPMDFSTMQSKMNTMQYSSPLEFVADLRLTFMNCQQYNRAQSYEAKKGRVMWGFVERRIRELEIPTESAISKSQEPTSPNGDGSKRVRRKKVITDL